MNYRARLWQWPFWLDGLISLAFGITTRVTPQTTLGELFHLPAGDQSLLWQLFERQGEFYIWLGLACFLVAFLRPNGVLMLATMLLVRHGWLAISGWQGRHAPWLAGSPYPDIVIHTLFVLAFVWVLIRTLKTVRPQPAPGHGG